MKNLRNRFERFCLRNRDKGIPNLMLYITLGAGLVFVLSMIDGGSILYEWLRFDKAAILKGQVWRLFTYVLTYAPGSSGFLVLIGLYFFYNLARHVELSMGTFKFNLYYFSGLLLMDVFALLVCPITDVQIGGMIYPVQLFTVYYSNMALYMHLSLLLAYCVTNPNAQFLIFFIIPVKAWFLSLVYLLMIAFDIYNYSVIFPNNLLPLAGLLNFLIYAGKDIIHLLPEGIRPLPKRRSKASGPIRFDPVRKHEEKPKVPVTHRCTVCGRTDVSNPELEFRYCSRCNGYHCYCEEHISNHTHIE